MIVTQHQSPMQSVKIDPEFIRYLSGRLPDPNTLADVIAACQRPLRKSIRVNTLRISVESLRIKLSQQGWQLTPIPWCAEGFWIERPESQQQDLSLGNCEEHLEGLFYIQEASSMLPATALFHQVQPGIALDMAAAPGSKTTQLSALMDNQGLLVANELSSSRVKVLAANIQRCGVVNVALSHFDGQVFGQYCDHKFDAVLLDAPCSGEGTVRKDPMALEHWDQTQIQSIKQVQSGLIDSAIHALKPGGILIYSTCTLNHFENQQVIEEALKRFPTQLEIVPLGELFEGADTVVTPDGFLHVWPHVFDSEGFFVACIKKRVATEVSGIKKRKGQWPFTKISNTQWSALERYLQHFGLALSQQRIFQRDDTLWVFPDEIQTLADCIKFQRIGVKLATVHKHGFRLTHDAAIAFCDKHAPNAIELEQSHSRLFFQGRDIPISANGLKGEVLLVANDSVIGLGKVMQGKIKNKLPRELVKNGAVLNWE